MKNKYNQIIDPENLQNMQYLCPLWCYFVSDCVSRVVAYVASVFDGIEF